jgi:hypothetical protein
MELFITEIPEYEPPKTIRPQVDNYDVHSEDKASGFCEICWSQDELRFLTLWHPTKGEHTLAHVSCVQQSNTCEEWLYCTCQ